MRKPEQLLEVFRALNETMSPQIRYLNNEPYVRIFDVSPRIRAAIEAAVNRVNGPPGEPEGAYEHKWDAALEALRGERGHG